MANPNPSPNLQNLTRAGMGAPPKPEKVKLTTTINKTTKSALKAMKGAIGDNIDRLYLDNGKLRLRLHELELENEGLRDRLQRLSPTDLP